MFCCFFNQLVDFIWQTGNQQLSITAFPENCLFDNLFIISADSDEDLMDNKKNIIGDIFCTAFFGAENHCFIPLILDFALS